jgi:hypothetical protein
MTVNCFLEFVKVYSIFGLRQPLDEHVRRASLPGASHPLALEEHWASFSFGLRQPLDEHVRRASLPGASHPLAL